MNVLDRLVWDRFANQHRPCSLAEAVDAAVETERRDNVTVWTVLADVTHPLDALMCSAPLPRVETARCHDAAAVKVEDDTGEYVIGIWATSHNGVFHIAGSVPVTDPRWKKVERWVVRAEPWVGPVFLDEQDLHRIVAGLESVGQVSVNRLTARMISDGSSYTRGWKRASGHDQPTLSEVLREVAGRASIRTLSVDVGDTLALHVRRDAGATHYRGPFGLFDTHVLRPMADAALQRIRLLSGRERRIDNERPSRAISIRFGTPVFANESATEELLTAICRQQEAGIAVLHRNPYLHMVVTDYRDGSNFDAFVTSDDEVTIFPGYRASVGSLSRITKSIGERFAAASIQDAPASIPPTEQDLLTTG